MLGAVEPWFLLAVLTRGVWWHSVAGTAGSSYTVCLSALYVEQPFSSTPPRVGAMLGIPEQHFCCSSYCTQQLGRAHAALPTIWL